MGDIDIEALEGTLDKPLLHPLPIATVMHTVTLESTAQYQLAPVDAAAAAAPAAAPKALQKFSCAQMVAATKNW
jgi:hypothetical protein